MPYVKRTVRAGDTIEVKKYYTSRIGKKDKGMRAEKSNITPEKMAEVNEKNAVEKLTWILNANFSEGDLHCRLTYADEYYPTPEEARENMRRFLRVLRRVYKTMGIKSPELKYVNATEYENKRIHHHLVIPEINPKTVQDLWQYGRTFFSVLDGSGDYRKLAEYLVKETRKSYKGNPVSAKRWNASKNMIKPEISKEIIEADSWTEFPKPVKGYYIPKTSIEMDVDAYGFPYQKYVMIKIPERKGMRNGKYRSYNGPLNC